MQQRKRVYQEIGAGLVVEAPYAITPDGQMVSEPCKAPGVPVKKQLAVSKGLPVLSNNQISEMKQNKMKYGAGQPNGLPLGVNYGETPQGKPYTYRSEKQTVSGQRQVFRFKVNNGEATEEVIVIGDPTGEVKRQLGVSAPKAGVTFSGMYGADTYTQLQNILGYIPMDLHTIKFQGFTTAGAASTAFFDSGRFGLCEFSVGGNTLKNEELVLADLITPDVQQTNIRQDPDFRFQIGAYTAFALTIPAGESILVTCTIKAAGITREMDLVSR